MTGELQIRFPNLPAVELVYKHSAAVRMLSEFLNQEFRKTQYYTRAHPCQCESRSSAVYKIVDHELEEWWQRELVQLPKKTRRLKAAMMIYGAWGIWKARNQCIFEHKRTTPAEVLQEIKMEVNCRKLACGGPVLPSDNV